MTDDKKPMDLKWRLYGLVPYNLSPIQQAIQYGHALQEMNNEMISLIATPYKYGPDKEKEIFYFINSFDKWRELDKTFIILNGGTTNKTRGENFGTLNKNMDYLLENQIKFFPFYEPDLGDQLTAIVFLVDERVWNKEKYPDFQELSIEEFPNSIVERRNDWVDSIGEKNVWLREFLKQFKLA